MDKMEQYHEIGDRLKDFEFTANSALTNRTEDHVIHSSFLFICECKSYTHIFHINYMFTLKLPQLKDVFKTHKKKPLKYTIALYDIYKDEYWIYDKVEAMASQSISITKEIEQQIHEIVQEYVTENQYKFDKCMMEMSIYLLNKMNKYDPLLLKAYFTPFFQKYTHNNSFRSQYLDQFVAVVDEMIANETKVPMGNYILMKYKPLFDDIMISYASIPFNDPTITDAHFIVRTIDILCK